MAPYLSIMKTQPAHKPLIMRRSSFPLRGLFLFLSINHLTVGSFSINSFFNSRLQKYSITTIHHDEKNDFFFHLVNSATMEINYEDMCILQFGQSQ